MIRLSLVLASLLLCSASYAGLYVEPLIGYQYGKLEVTQKGGTASKLTSTGPGAGIGVGWTFGKISAGLDLEAMMLKTKDSIGTYNQNWKQYTADVVVGYEVQPKTRIYLGVGGLQFKDESTPVQTFSGTTAKIGAVYEFKNHIAVDAEGVLYTPTEFKAAGGTSQQVTSSFDQYNYYAVVWNIRFPFGSFSSK
jgi:predicted porin